MEYATAEEAESTWRNLREASIKGNKMEISFSVPGLSAVVVYNKIIQRKVSSIKYKDLKPYLFKTYFLGEITFNLRHHGGFFNLNL